MAEANPNFHSVVDQDGAAILDIDRGLISTLNPTGAYVWQRLENGESLATIIANLVRETGEEHLVVEKDVHEFVQALRENHLVAH
ncbi:PqqD family protein [Acidicapsa acidisoli]|uniref:PqqD family protein n=1 Tax=Acidicapsa acidisoli TaxID=1615681 RepID=UPI0021DFAE77|nr:PqqD family protein [Acidicapsa acidisoli]